MMALAKVLIRPELIAQIRQLEGLDGRCNVERLILITLQRAINQVLGDILFRKLAHFEGQSEPASLILEATTLLPTPYYAVVANATRGIVQTVGCLTGNG